MADLLFLTQRIPYPPTKGDKIRSWHILRHLAASWRVHLGCFVDDPHDRIHVPTLAELCATVHCEPLNPALARVRSLTALAKGEPLTLGYFGSGRLRDWVDRTVRENRIEHVFVFCSAMAPYAAGLSEAVRILDMVDVDSQKWQQYAAKSGGVGRMIYGREARSLLRLERRMAQLFDRTLFVSPAEAGVFRALAPECAARVLSLTNGVDADFFSPDRLYPTPFRSDGTKVVFTGAMDYRPNIEAVCWFADAVIPALKSGGCPIEFWIVGANPAAPVRRLSERADIHVTGRVEDVRPFLFHADAVVAPLLTARGIQNKVLEAMAMAKAVVATPQAMEGINAVEGEEVLVAAEPTAFVSRMRIALSEQGRAVGLRARHRVEQEYTWARSLSALDGLLDKGGSSGFSSDVGAARARVG